MNQTAIDLPKQANAMPSMAERMPVFTTKAAQRAKTLLAIEANAELCLRVFISGGGCAGFQYGFTFDIKTDDDDTVISTDGISLLVDALSFPYLEGAAIDYEEGLEGARFIVNNPNATTTCGCGSSFAIDIDIK